MPSYSLQFPTFTSYDLNMELCDRDKSISSNPVFAWLSYGKIGESQTVQPRYSTVSVEPTARNRFLTDVIVSPITPSVYTVQLAVGATMSASAVGLYSATSSDVAVATVAVVNGVATITGVASGSAIIKILDNADDLMYTVNVTIA